MACREEEGGRPPAAAAGTIVVTLAMNQELTHVSTAGSCLQIAIF